MSLSYSQSLPLPFIRQSARTRTSISKYGTRLHDLRGARYVCSALRRSNRTIKAQTNHQKPLASLQSKQVGVSNYKIISPDDLKNKDRVTDLLEPSVAFDTQAGLEAARGKRRRVQKNNVTGIRTLINHIRSIITPANGRKRTTSRPMGVDLRAAPLSRLPPSFLRLLRKSVFPDV